MTAWAALTIVFYTSTCIIISIHAIPQYRQAHGGTRLASGNNTLLTSIKIVTAPPTVPTIITTVSSSTTTREQSVNPTTTSSLSEAAMMSQILNHVYSSAGETNTTNGRDGFASQLEPGENLAVGQSLWSPNQTTKLMLQADGNLVLYRLQQTLIWSAGTDLMVKKPALLKVTNNGDVVLHNAAGEVVWKLGTDGEPSLPAILQVEDADGGRLCLSKNGTCIWMSKRKQ
ncbi:hypothetical protein BV898_00161 [Hypsibius exemplaris]|uniref:Bulb-type lectin domain-containing protein n=1 Tax=Hypsibius exemplaris TaxID=2072580 RepID=A0A1W0XFA1_HYPEX|nr:hypothetical protein BV898_00161 [Hypsibius exemplaris]